MHSHRELWRLLQRGLHSEEVAKIIIAEVERRRASQPLWSDVEIERLKRLLAHDSKARHAYSRVINRYSREHGLDLSQEEIDQPSEIDYRLTMRWFLEVDP